MVRLLGVTIPGLRRGRTLAKTSQQHSDYSQVKQVSRERAGDQAPPTKDPPRGRKPPPQPLQLAGLRAASQPDRSSPTSPSKSSGSPTSPTGRSPTSPTGRSPLRRFSESRSQSRSPKSPNGRSPAPLAEMPRASTGGGVGMAEIAETANKAPPPDVEKDSYSEHDTEELDSAAEDTRIPCGSYVLGAVLAVVLAAAGWYAASAVANRLQQPALRAAHASAAAREEMMAMGDRYPTSTSTLRAFASAPLAGSAILANASTTTTTEDAPPGEASTPSVTTTGAKLPHASPAASETTTTTATAEEEASTRTTTTTTTTAKTTSTAQKTTTRTTRTTTTTTPTTSTTGTVVTQSQSTTTAYQSLLCFSVVQANGYELALVKMQVGSNVSIFACDEFAVFSDTRVLVAHRPPADIWTTVLGVNLHASVGLKSHLLNTEIFLKAWENPSVRDRYAHFDWTVKVDPDAVFFPDRLRTHMALTWAWDYPGAKTNGLYIRNCHPLADGLGLYGAIEILSRRAVEVLLTEKGRCMDASELGEDLFMQHCLDSLDVKHVYDFGLIADAYCRENPSPCVAGKVAFHPFKSTATYSMCLQEAGWKVAQANVILK